MMSSIVCCVSASGYISVKFILHRFNMNHFVASGELALAIYDDVVNIEINLFLFPDRTTDLPMKYRHTKQWPSKASERSAKPIR